MKLQFNAHGHSWPGTCRENNEDSYLVSSIAAAVADGVGGAPGGELASALVIHHIAAVARALHGQQFSESDVWNTVAAANTALGRLLRQNESLKGMATTLTALFGTGKDLVVVHIGDSRAYLFRRGEIHQESRDDSFVQDLVDTQIITVEESSHHPLRSVVRKVLTGDNSNSDSLASMVRHDLQSGDRWLIASDGLTDYVPDELIKDALSSGSDPEACVTALIALAEQHESADNVTVVVCDISDHPAEGGVLVGGSAAESTTAPLAETGSPETSPKRGHVLQHPTWREWERRSPTTAAKTVIASSKEAEEQRRHE